MTQFAAGGLVSREGWPMGPWSGEPEDLVTWQQDPSDWWCAAVRNAAGCWAGFVMLPNDHPIVGKASAPLRWKFSVYNGLTYSSDTPPHPMLATPEPRWWAGFETGHFLDVVPANPSLMGRPRRYRTIRFVREEATRLCHRLVELYKRAIRARDRVL